MQKANSEWKLGIGYSKANVAALMRDEYILRHKLDRKRNFSHQAPGKMRNEAYEQMVGKLK